MGCGASTQAHANAAARPGDVHKLETDTVKGSVEAKAWAGQAIDGSLPFPELEDGDFHMDALAAKPEFAVCLSGGEPRLACAHDGICATFPHARAVEEEKKACSSGS